MDNRASSSVERRIVWTARASLLATIVVAPASFAACDGESMVPDAGAVMDGATDEPDAGDGGSVIDGGPPAPTCGADGDECPAGICQGDECVPSVCGDGVVDARSGEECDDGNDVPRDGCEPVSCARTRCETAEECSDGEACNGEETCDPSSGLCSPGTPLAVEAACASDDVASGVCRVADGLPTCVPPACGNGVVEGDEQCDDGNTDSNDGCRTTCLFTCVADAQCDDRSVCNGRETCETATHRCVEGTRPDCADRNACTMDVCLPVIGCVNRLLDADGDGHAPTSLGACGTDCDDSRADVHPDMEELCDGLDHDCDGTPSSGTPPSWYRDCDEDGYAPLSVLDGTDTVRVSCTEPAAAGGCGWTTRRPRESAALSRDCDDGDADVRPRATEIAGDGVDQNCDGRELCYADADGDDFRAISGATVASSDADCNDAGEALSSAPATDCCDIDDDVHVGQTQYFVPASACGSWDYNCDSSSTRQYTATASAPSCGARETIDCFDPAVGWLGSQPLCGQSRTWQTGCMFEGAAGGGSCESVTTTRMQGCR